MTPLLATLVIAVLMGIALKLIRGRPRATSQPGTTLASFGISPGDAGTIVEVTTAQCADCAATHLALTEAAAAMPGITVHLLPAESHPAVLRDWHVLQAPTTFFFNDAGRLVSRAAGRMTRSGIATALEGLRS